MPFLAMSDQVTSGTGNDRKSLFSSASVSKSKCLSGNLRPEIVSIYGMPLPVQSLANDQIILASFDFIRVGDNNYVQIRMDMNSSWFCISENRHS